jgi:endogenous inhibitor of DNA gyrase (YacG/DUF329 family)
MKPPEQDKTNEPADLPPAEDVLPQLNDSDLSAPSNPSCPICDSPVQKDSEFFPFCSKQCRLIDFGKWMGGDYMVSRPIDQSDLDEV